MKIILDNDATLTDFNKFVEENAIKYFSKKYNMNVVYPNKLEIEDIFDIKNTLISRGYNEKEALELQSKMLDQFWISLRFVKFSLLNRFKPGVTKFINDLIKQGHKVEIHTSRAKTCNKDIVGSIARNFTIWQYRLNGIFLSKDKFYFYQNDEEKIKALIDMKPDIVFDDKPSIIEQLNNNNIKTICVSGKHNQNLKTSKNVEIINVFDEENINKKFEILLGKNKLKYYNKEANSEILYTKLKKLQPLILSKFKPIILNSENIINTDQVGIVYAPNHRSTLDPIIITAILKESIHWAALLRFFEGNDSIFNNSKNPILCKITADCFKKLEFFPIDRIKDNPKANNFESIRNMNNFLMINSKIGIFGEGTTNRPENLDFNPFDDSFIVLARRTDSWIQPITTLWIKDLNLKQKVIINFGKPFKVNNMSVEDAMKYFMEIQINSLNENKDVKEKLISQNKPKVLKKTFKNK